VPALVLTAQRSQASLGVGQRLLGLADRGIRLLAGGLSMTLVFALMLAM